MKFLNTLLAICISLVFAFRAPQVQAHSEAAPEGPTPENYMRILERLSDLNVEPPDVTTSLKPLVRVGGKKIVIDNAFWDLADEISRLYVAEIKASCHECQMPAIEAIRAEAKNLVAQGWAQSKAQALQDAVLYRYADEAIGLTAEFGAGAGAAKVAGELVEDALLVLFKMPGAHFLCEAITLGISVFSGSALTLWRGLSLPHNFDRGRLTSLVQLAVTSYYAKRALKRLTIEIPEISLNEEAIQEFVDEHPEKSWYYRITGQHRVEKFLNYVVGLNPEDTFHLKRKVFSGYRRKTLFLLKRRNGSQTLSRFTPMTKPLFHKTSFWFFSLENEIFEPHVLNEAQELPKGKTFPEPSADLNGDAITQYQLSRYSDPQAQKNAAKIFETLDRMGDKNQSSADRYFHLTLYEAFFGSFLPRVLKQVVDYGLQDLPRDERNLLDFWKLRWKMGRLKYHTAMFTDFLRYKTFDRKNSDPTQKYHVREYALEILNAYSSLSSLGPIQSLEDQVRMKEALSSSIHSLWTNRFWVEKTKTPRLFPRFFGGPTCESIYR